MGIVHTIIRAEVKMPKICVNFVPRVLREDQKERRFHDSKEMVEPINSDPAVLDALVTGMKTGSTAMTQRPRDRVPSRSMLALPDPRRPDRANPAINFWWSLFLTALAWSTCTGLLLDSQQGILCWSSGRDSVGRGQYSSNRVSGIFTRTMHQSTTASLSQTI